FPEWLHNLDVDKIRKQASEIKFASQATPDVMLSGNKKTELKIDQAEGALAANEDPARCYLVLARAASLSGNMQDAKDDFVKAASTSKDPHIVAWSHI